MVLLLSTCRDSLVLSNLVDSRTLKVVDLVTVLLFVLARCWSLF